MVGEKNAFWQALIVTFGIFIIGILIGMWFEGFRTDKISKILVNSEINLLDEQMRDDVLGVFSVQCDDAVGSVFSFADKIYSEAELLEKYDSSSTLGNDMEVLHKRYDLLRLMLWMESISLKEKCKKDFHTIAYVYSYKTEDISKRALQISWRRVLLDLKEKYGAEVLLIPIAGDLNLSAVELVAQSYNLKEFPSVIIDGNKVLSDLATFNELEKAVFG